ncbi:MAG: GGDEF domain-containing protein [Planctomycetota bacterium]|nr:GGDEF domain-containing protein [Planctomycetota bacterium]
MAHMETPTINVLLLVANNKPQFDWTDQASLRVWPDCKYIPPTLQPDVVISDCPQLPHDALTNPQLQDPTQFGLILVGCESVGRSADVHLPADATGREMQLACQLLGAMVQQRRLERSRAGEFQMLAQWALQDPLTGLANRRAWDQQVQELASSGAALTKPLCLAMLDVDKLKNVNDARGHDAGDAVLRAAASGLRSALRISDFAARWGGDEFALILQDVPPQHACAIVERIRTATDRQIIEQTDQTITLSAGLVGIAAGTVFQTDRLWQQADAALLKAKQSGGSRSVECTTPELQAE